MTKAVWNLSRHSAGMMVRFKTDATTIRAKWKLLSSRLGMPHMPPSGVSGLDLYARDSKGQWRWAAATKPNKQDMEATLLSGIAAGMREYALYLPLYNGTESLEIGVPKGEVGKQNPPLLRPPGRKREGGPLRPIGERARRCHYQENEPSTQRNIG